MLDKDLLKQWLKSRAKPNQNQFWQWVDACFFKGEKLPITDVEGLENILNNLAAPPQIVDIITSEGIPVEYTLPPGYLLETIALKAAVDMTVSAETTANPDTNDIMYPEDIEAAKGALWVINRLGFNADLNITVSGVPAGGTIYFVRKKIFNPIA